MAKFFTTFVLLLALFLCFLSLGEAAPKDALITHLPGFNGTLPSKHYSGYVTIDEKHGKNLFYYFVVSERKPSEDPVVLWLNGGPALPGCSSFDGFIFEHGPFNFQAARANGSLPELHVNPYSWSKVSNIIYLDSPAGVGLSYSENPDDYKTGDLKTASDAHTFLLKWFEQYPEFLSNPFYISGESYGGVYVPTLASEVVKGIDAGLKPVLNFKGYMVGNGITDYVFDGNALVPFVHGMGLISDEMFQDANTSCQGNYWAPVSSACDDSLDKVAEVIVCLNMFDILEPCYHISEERKLETGNIRKRIFGRDWTLTAPIKGGIVNLASQQVLLNSKNISCEGDEVSISWLNNDAVRKAIHARQRNLTWELCTDKVDYNQELDSVIPYHKNLTTRGYRALIYSGDHDMSVPFTGTRAWTRSLGYNILDQWRPWFLNDMVAGFTQGYEHNLTFLTIIGAGHTVAEYKPREALAFYSRWLAGEKI